MKKRILCYGDSNTWGQVPGVGTRYPEEHRWPMVAQKILGEDYVILEESISGRTTAYDRGYDEELNGKKGLPYVLKAQRPLDGVIIALGINDITEYSVQSSMRGLEELVREVQFADTVFRASSPIFGKEPKVLVIGTPPLHPSVKEATQLTSSFAGKYEDSCLLAEADRLVAEKRRAEYLDATPYVEATPVDYVHYTPESHIRLGEAIAAKIKSMFGN